MSVVVERGLARCPRCVAVADYAFVESGPNSLRYEVDCRKCGEAYREVHNPVAPAFGATVDALVVLPAPIVPGAFDVRVRQFLASLVDVRDKAVARFGQLRTRPRSWRSPSPVSQEGAPSERV